MTDDLARYDDGVGGWHCQRQTEDEKLRFILIWCLQYDDYESIEPILAEKTLRVSKKGCSALMIG